MKKVFSLLLSLTMVMALLAGCGGDTTTDTADDSTTDTAGRIRGMLHRRYEDLVSDVAWRWLS